MIFGKVPVNRAEGVILAHSHQTSGGKIRKGQFLNDTHIAMLQADGIPEIVGVTLTDDDAHEDAAATAIAQALLGSCLRQSVASTGRVNVSGQIVATVKIIPYGVPLTILSKALDTIDISAVSVHPTTPRKACLIQTQLPSIKTATLEKTRQITENRLLQRQCNLLSEQRPTHAIDTVTQALHDAQSQHPDWILIFGASAISDRSDTIPSAIVNAGGTLERLGMPMDPGNLLLLGRIEHAVVIGMPGCARSARHNGVDRVLDRLACGATVDGRWIARLGVGGLLKEIVDRPRPRVIPKKTPVVSGLLLAAGSSTRFGEKNKLLAGWQGKALIQHSVQALAQSNVATITVVTGHEHEQVEQAVLNSDCNKTTLRFVHNEAFATGMASSVVRGFSSLIESDAVVVCLGDMPNVSNQIINTLVNAFLQNPSKAIYIPVYNGQRGNPVLIARRLFDSVLSLQGDTGARALAKQFSDSTLEVVIEDVAVRQDVDTVSDLDHLDSGSI